MRRVAPKAKNKDTDMSQNEAEAPAAETPVMPLREALQVEEEVVLTPAEDDKLTASFAKLLRETVDNRLLGLEKLEKEVVSLLLGYKGGLNSLQPSVEELMQGLQEITQVANRSREYAEILKKIAVVQGVNPETFTAQQIVHSCFASKQAEVLTPERVQLWVAGHIKEAYKLGFRTLGLGGSLPPEPKPVPPSIAPSKNPAVSKEDNVNEENPKKIDPKTLTMKDVETWALATKKPAREIGMVLIKHQGKPEEAIRKLVSEIDDLPNDPMIEGMLGWAIQNRASATMLIMKIGPKLL